MSHPEIDDYNDYDDFDDGYATDDLDCTHCGGEGVEECYEPIAGCRGCPAGCAGFDTYAPCGACDGSGLRSQQRTF